MSSTINIVGTGGIIEGDFDDANVNVNLDAAYNFVGSDDEHITIADNSALDLGAGDMTLSCWTNAIYTNQGSSYNALITKGAAGTSDTAYGLSLEGNGVVRFKAGANQVLSTSSGAYANDGSFAHIAGVKNGTTFKIYINGVEAASATKSDVDTDNNDALILAGDTGAVRHITGKLGDVRIYNTALSASNIQVLASKINVNQTLGAGTTNLVGRWPIIGTSIDITDNSSNSNNGTAVNSPTTVYDAFSVNVQDNSTTTDGTFTVTQGKVEGLSLTCVDLDGTNDYITFPSSASVGAIGAADYTIAGWFNTDSSNQQVYFTTGPNAANGGSNDNLFISIDPGGNYLGLGSAVAWKHQATTTITQNVWHQFILTRVGTVSKWYLDGVLVGTGTDSTTWTASTLGYLGQNGGGTQDFNGEMRDVRIYDYGLSEDQAASLYAGNYNVTPDHWWKIDDATQTATATIEDYGTGTDADGTGVSLGTWVNGTLDLDGTLTIAANGTLSAPRGNLTLGATGTAIDINCTTVADQWINNSGKVIIDSSGAHATLLPNGATFNNLDVDTGSGHDVKLQENLTILGTLDLTDSTDNWIMDANGAGGDVTLTMGSSTASGTIESAFDSRFRLNTHSSGKCIIQGASSLFPCNVTSNDWYWDYGSGAAGTELANIDFQTDLETHKGGSNTAKITLTGDCEFDAVTVSSGDTLDLNGQRAEFGGNFELTGGGTPGVLDWASSMFICKGTINLNGRFPTSDANTIIIHDPTSASEKAVTSMYSNGTFFNQNNETEITGYGWTSGTPDYVLEKVFVGGTLDCQQHLQAGDIQTATGGDLRGVDRTITCEGDFTTSGGLLGTSCLTLNGSDEFAAQTSATTWGINNAYTIEMWLKTSTDSDMVLFDMDNGSDNANRIVLACNASTNEIKLSAFASNGTETGLFTGNVFGQDFHDGKWHHLAVTNSGSEIKIYADGKLNKQLTATVSRSSDPSMRLFIGKKKNDSEFFNGEIEEVRIFTDVRTEAEIRADMFQGGTLANSGNLSARYSFDEGSGTAVDNSQGTDGRDLVASGTGVWAGAGTFTYGTSTVDLTGTGDLSYEGNTSFYNLKCAASTKTTTVNRRSSGAIQIRNNLYHGGGTLDRSGSVTYSFMASASAPLSGATSPIVMDKCYVVYWSSTGVVPASTWEYFISDVSPVTLGADVTSNNYFNTSTYETALAGNTLTVNEMKFGNSANAHLNIGSGSLVLANVLGLSTSYAGNQLSAGPGCTISGTNAATTFKSQNDWNVVGNVENLNVTNEELKVTGLVTNCTGDIHQYFPTIDHDQQIDADTADDRDIQLHGDKLDRDTELINS